MIELVDPGDVFGHAVFCDDIRQEANGKFIYIGVYEGVMVIHAPFPVKLNRIAFAISVGQRAEKLVPKITYRIFLPGDEENAPSIEAEVSEQTPGAFIEAAENGANAAGISAVDRKFSLSSANLMFDGVEIKQPGSIKVRVDVDGKRYRIGSLSVVAAKKSASEDARP